MLKLYFGHIIQKPTSLEKQWRESWKGREKDEDQQHEDWTQLQW